MPENRSLTYSQLQQAIDYIHAHLNHDLSLAELASAVNISPTYLASLFKRTMGISPHQYVIQRCRGTGKFLVQNSQILNLLRLCNWKPKLMLIQKLNNCEEIIAGDGTVLRELLHPDKQDINLRYSLAYAILPVGKTSIPHSLKTSEVYYIISGVGEMSIDSEVRRIEPGDAVYIPPNAIQFLHNYGDEPIVFVCLVDPAWRKEDETIYAPV